MTFDRQLLLQALDEAADFIVVTDDTPPSKNGPLVVYANRSFQEALGLHGDQIIGKPYTIFFSPRNPPRVAETIVRALAQRESSAREMLALRNDGTDFWLEFVAKPFWEHDGHEYWLSIGRDITMRRRALSQMALLFAAIEQTSDEVALYEPTAEGQMQVTYENERAHAGGDERLLALWDAQTPTGRDIRSRLEAGSEVEEFFAELDRNGRPKIVQFNARAIRSDSRIEGIVTLERTLAATNGERTTGSVLLRISALLPALTRARSAAERQAILRAILLDAFDAEMYEAPVAAAADVRIIPERKRATIRLGSVTFVVHWQQTLASAMLTALRFCLEAAVEQAQQPQPRY